MLPLAPPKSILSYETPACASRRAVHLPAGLVHLLACMMSYALVLRFATWTVGLLRPGAAFLSVPVAIFLVIGTCELLVSLSMLLPISNARRHTGMLCSGIALLFYSFGATIAGIMLFCGTHLVGLSFFTILGLMIGVPSFALALLNFLAFRRLAKMC